MNFSPIRRRDADDRAAMPMQAWLWTATGAALALAAIAGVADWRRTHRRRAIEAVGWVPWRGLQVAVLFAAFLLALLAVHA
jgi:uncharacterized membrane protein